MHDKMYHLEYIHTLNQLYKDITMRLLPKRRNGRRSCIHLGEGIIAEGDVACCKYNNPRQPILKTCPGHSQNLHSCF